MKTRKVMILIPIFLMLITALFSFKKEVQSSPYKCMIQMKNYAGEGAYIVISLLNPQGQYEETLYVQGKNPDWYFDIKEWWSFYGKKRTTIDAITGATISAGERNSSVIRVDDDKLNKGYRIRFETAVEDVKYHKDDIEFELTSANMKSKFDGKGFIRYVKIKPQQKI
jgi:hypothetical protein